ncbi:MAG: uroporphyrinogen-III synthase [Alphaproteobacteria bacterium]|nr:MAG: uroporphyrinogen-III synthase [Alphaproteobacteria bacterium]
MSDTLAGRLIAVPETRALDLFCDMLEGRGATAMRCPMVRIRDAEDGVPIEAWLNRFVTDPPHVMIFYTGEGLMRLVGFADRMGCEEAFVDTLSKIRKITRGPKPVKALRSIGLDTDLRAVSPTTDGLVETLQGEDLAGQRVGVQLYPDHKARALLDLLDALGANVDRVIPYRYVPAQESTEAARLIERMAEGAVDLIAITSMAQISHLFDVAAALGIEDALADGLTKTDVASVGPVATEALQARGYEPTIVAPEPFALKSLVRRIEAHFAP